jgi:hypothetical protein
MPVLGRVVVERQQRILVADDLLDGLGELRAVELPERPDRGLDPVALRRSRALTSPALRALAAAIGEEEAQRGARSV